MSTFQNFSQTCRHDRNVAYTALGVSFWFLVAGAFFASHVVMDVMAR